MDQVKILLLCLLFCSIVGFIMWRTIRRQDKQSELSHPGPGASNEEVDVFCFQEIARAIEVDRARTPEEMQRLDYQANLAALESGGRIEDGQRVARDRLRRKKY